MNDQSTDFFLVPTSESMKDNYKSVLKFFAIQLKEGDDQETDLVIRTKGKKCSYKAWRIHDHHAMIKLIYLAYELFRITLRAARLYIDSEYAEFCTI